MTLIVHFTQDFRRGKTQLGGFARIFNETSDGANDHIVYTLHLGSSHDETFKIEHLDVISLGVPVDELRWWNRWLWARRLGRRIAQDLQERGLSADVLFGHSQLFNYDVLCETKRRVVPKPPLLWEANVVWGINVPHGLRGGVSARSKKHKQRKVFKRSDAIVAQTEASRMYITSRFEVPLDKVRVVTNGVSPQFEARSAARPVVREPREVLCVGLFDDMNGAPFLLDVLRDDDFHRLRFTFIGDGVRRPLVEKAAADGICQFVPGVPYSEMPGRFAAAHFLVVPRLAGLEADLFIPTKVIEAMAVGLVVLGSDVGGIDEVITDGVDGFLFEAGDRDELRSALYRLQSLPPSRYAAVSAAAVATAMSRFPWSEQHRRLDAAYRELVNK